MRYVEFESSRAYVISTIGLIAQVRTGIGTSLGIPVQYSLQLARARWESNPLTFYCTVPSKNTEQRDFLLQTLSKLGLLECSLLTRFERAYLQDSRESTPWNITLSYTNKTWWKPGESNPSSR